MSVSFLFVGDLNCHHKEWLGLLIGKVWGPVIHFCACPIHCKVLWRGGRRLEFYRLILAQPLIGSRNSLFALFSGY